MLLLPLALALDVLVSVSPGAELGAVRKTAPERALASLPAASALVRSAPPDQPLDQPLGRAFAELAANLTGFSVPTHWRRDRWTSALEPTAPKRLGGGSFGEVVKAKLSCGRQTAVVKLQEAKGASLEEIKNEVAIMARVRGTPGIIQLFSYGGGPSSRLYSILMEIGAGGDLQHFFAGTFMKGGAGARAERSAKFGDMLRFTAEMLTALTVLHEQNIIHRDLKPGNIFVQCPMGARECSARTSGAAHPILGDLGGAKATHDGVAHGQFGTPLYMSPEAWDGQTTAASDNWAIGIMALEFLARKHPFGSARSIAALTVQITTYDFGRHRSTYSSDCLALARSGASDDVSYRNYTHAKGLCERFLTLLQTVLTRQADEWGGVRASRHAGDTRALAREAKGISDEYHRAVGAATPDPRGVMQSLDPCVCRDPNFGPVFGAGSPGVAEKAFATCGRLAGAQNEAAEAGLAQERKREERAARLAREAEQARVQRLREEQERRERLARLAEQKRAERERREQLRREQQERDRAKRAELVSKRDKLYRDLEAAEKRADLACQEVQLAEQRQRQALDELRAEHEEREQRRASRHRREVAPGTSRLQHALDKARYYAAAGEDQAKELAKLRDAFAEPEQQLLAGQEELQKMARQLAVLAALDADRERLAEDLGALAREASEARRQRAAAETKVRKLEAQQLEQRRQFARDREALEDRADALAKRQARQARQLDAAHARTKRLEDEAADLREALDAALDAEHEQRATLRDLDLDMQRANDELEQSSEDLGRWNAYTQEKEEQIKTLQEKAAMVRDDLLAEGDPNVRDEAKRAWRAAVRMYGYTLDADPAHLTIKEEQGQRIVKFERHLDDLEQLEEDRRQEMNGKRRRPGEMVGPSDDIGELADKIILAQARVKELAAAYDEADAALEGARSRREGVEADLRALEDQLRGLERAEDPLARKDEDAAAQDALRRLDDELAALQAREKDELEHLATQRDYASEDLGEALGAEHATRTALFRAMFGDRAGAGGTGAMLDDLGSFHAALRGLEAEGYSPGRDARESGDGRVDTEDVRPDPSALETLPDPLVADPSDRPEDTLDDAHRRYFETVVQDGGTVAFLPPVVPGADATLPALAGTRLLAGAQLDQLTRSVSAGRRAECVEQEGHLKIRFQYGPGRHTRPQQLLQFAEEQLTASPEGYGMGRPTVLRRASSQYSRDKKPYAKEFKNNKKERKYLPPALVEGCWTLVKIQDRPFPQHSEDCPQSTVSAWGLDGFPRSGFTPGGTNDPRGDPPDIPANWCSTWKTTREWELAKKQLFSDWRSNELPPVDGEFDLVFELRPEPCIE